MGMIYRLDDFRLHGRTSTGTRAAKRARRFASTPAALATDVLQIAVHHSEGMRSRCDHFGIEVTGAPVSSDIAPCEDHSAMTSLNDLGRFESAMSTDLGQIVLNDKAALSCDDSAGDRQIQPMTLAHSNSQFLDAFVDRTKWARQSHGMTQKEMADELGLSQDHYKHFESDRILPAEYIERFCKICGIDANWLFTQHGRAPALSREAAEARMPSRPRKPKRRAKAA